MDFSAQSPVVTLSTVEPVAQTTNTVGNDVSSSAIDSIVNLPSIFDLLDFEGNGDLDRAEFKSGLNSIGVSITHDEAIMLFESIDTENEGYINKDSFMDWLSSSQSAMTPQMCDIRNKLVLALNAAQDISDPLGDMLVEDEIVSILGNKAEYVDELEQIKAESLDSDGTFKVNESRSDDDDEDSLGSSERKAIEVAKIKRDSEEARNLESALMEEEMRAMLDQEKYALEREISGRNTYREEDASKWKKEEIENEFRAMQLHARKLSQASLSIDQVQDEVNKTMQEFRKLSQNEPKKKLKPPLIQIETDKNQIETPASPIREIRVTTHEHTTAAQPVMIEQQRRNSLSEQSQSYSHYQMTDISQYTQTQQQQRLIKSTSIGRSSS
eukprot:388039_1